METILYIMLWIILAILYLCIGVILCYEIKTNSDKKIPRILYVFICIFCIPIGTAYIMFVMLTPFFIKLLEGLKEIYSQFKFIFKK